MTVRGLMSPGMRRVSRGLVASALDAGIELCPIDMLGSHPCDVTSFFRNGGSSKPVGAIKSNIFVLLDASWFYIHELRPFCERLRQRGVKLVALVCDTVPLDHPELCSEGTISGFTGWIDEVFDLVDLIVCISETTARRVRHHLALRHPKRISKCAVKSWLPGNEPWLPSEVDQGNSFVPAEDFILCVGTVEPRKNYAFLLEAMEGMWREGRTNCAMVMFGGKGWKTEDLIQKLEKHPEKGQRLFWFDGGSDAHLQQLYHACKALALPSIDEGLSLPLSEAAAVGKPVVLSDIPIFRERVISGGYFFQLGDIASLQAAVLQALSPRAVPCVVPQVDWATSAREFIRIITEHPKTG